MKRFGRRQALKLDWCVVHKMDVDCSLKKLQTFVKESIVHVVKTRFWSEDCLFKWLEENFTQLGFEYVLKERTPKYLQLKKEMQFFGFPDYLVMKNGKWLKLEIECFSSEYHHGINYADIVLCYEQDRVLPNVECLSLKDFFHCQEIINISEISAFLYLYDEDFKSNYERLATESYEKKMGLT